MATDTEQLVLSISADTRQIMNAMKRLTGEIAKSTSGIQKQFDSVGRGIDKAMTTSMQKRIDAMVGIGTDSTKEWTGALADQGRELERMRARFSPVFSVITRYKTTLTDIKAAHRLGALSSEEMTAAIQRERRAALGSIAAIKQRNAVLADTPVIGGNLNSMNTANLAAQFQDIGVTTAMGMSPLQIALQQGTQLSAILNQMGSGRQVIQGLGAAFLSVINPISLVTIGTIAATTAAAQYFFASKDGAEGTEKALQAQADLIRRVEQAWGDALPAVRAYAAEQDRIAGRADAESTFAKLSTDTFKAIGTEVSTAGDAIQDVMDLLRNTVPPEQIVAIQRALGVLSETASTNKTTVEEMDAAHRALMDAFRSENVPVLKTAADAIAELTPRLAEANAEMARLAAEKGVNLMFEELQASIAIINSAKAREELRTLMDQAKEGEISIKDLLAELAKISSFAPDVSGIIGAFKDVAEAAQAARDAASSPMWTGKASQGGRTRYGGSGFMQLPETAPTPDRRVDPYFLPPDPRTGGGGISEAERQKKAIDDVVASLKFEQEQLGRTGTEQRIYNELKRAGVDINTETGRQIAGLVTTLEAERQAIEAGKRAMEARAQSMDHLFQMGSDAIGEIIDKSVSAEDAVKKLAVQLALAAAQAALLGSGPLAGLFGSGGSLFGGGSGFTGFEHAWTAAVPGLYAQGTANTGGQRGQPRGIVHGQEAVIPLPNGGKVPVQIQTPQMPSIVHPVRSPAGQAMTIRVDVTGAHGNAEILAMVEAGVSQGIAGYDRGRKARLAGDLPDLRRRGALK